METVSSSSPDVGDRAPDFELYTDENEAWRLSDHLETPVLLLFFPGAFTSVCTNELNLVSNELDQFGDTTVIGLSTDSPYVLNEYRSVHGFEVLLLSDHSAEVSEAYGAKYDGDFPPMNLDRISRRAAFLIDTDGIIQYREVLEDARNLPDFEAIVEANKKLLA